MTTISESEQMRPSVIRQAKNNVKGNIIIAISGTAYAARFVMISTGTVPTAAREISLIML